MSEKFRKWKKLQDEEAMDHGRLGDIRSPVKIEMSLKVVDARPKGKINEFKSLD